ncbi:hypothetical protein Tco_1553409 [Tanacetum coccineum]
MSNDKDEDIEEVRFSKSGDKKTKAKPSFSSISKAKASLLTKTSMLANGKTCDAILNKTFGVKIPTARTGAKQKKRKRKIGEIIMISSHSSSNLESTNGPSSFDTSSSKDTMRTLKNSGFQSQEANAFLSSPQTLFVKSSIPIKHCVLGLANGKVCDAILNNIFGVKIPTARTGAKQKKGKRKIRGGS